MRPISISLLLWATQTQAALKIAAALNVLEWTPMLIAKEDFYAGEAAIVQDGIPNLANDTSVDLGANSETQLLRGYGAHRNLRSVLTLAEVYYRVVASRKAGIAGPADLRGRRVGARPGTSAQYFVQTYLAAAAGLAPGDYATVAGADCRAPPCAADTLPGMLARGAVAAVGSWEPSVQLGADALGADAVVFGAHQTVYREIYNLATTAEKLADPAKRAEIVAFLRAVARAADVFRNRPDDVIPRVAEATGTEVAALREAWPVHRWTARVPPDMVDVLVEEDRYVAGLDNRTAMSRELLETLVDPSVSEEAAGV
ncbi:periplasmic binding protein-like II [Xylariomycetidae sp. FL0641]|nr:periplasmic binding protein-like II [Xylariomycetidae sp. FL0641]